MINYNQTWTEYKENTSSPIKKILVEEFADPDKSDDLAWFEFNSLPENTIPYIKQVIDSCLNNITYSECEGADES